MAFYIPWLYQIHKFYTWIPDASKWQELYDEKSILYHQVCFDTRRINRAWPAPSHYLNQCWHIVNWTLGNKLQSNFNRNSNIFFQEKAFENVVWKIAAMLSRHQCIKWKIVEIHYMMASLSRSIMYVWCKNKSPQMLSTLCATGCLWLSR